MRAPAHLLACAAALALAGCNLHLDETLLDDAGLAPADDASSDGATDASAEAEADATSDASQDAATDAPGDVHADTSSDAPHDTLSDVATDTPSDAAGCSGDLECTAGGGCVAGRCDLGTRACVYAVCPSQTACQARTCDTVQSTCNTPTDYGFHASTLDISASLACGGSLDACFAAVGHFAFLGTTSGLLAWDLSAPIAATPVAVTAPGFTIARIVASGSRLLVVGPFNAGSGALEWLDVPTDAVVASFTIDGSHSAFVTFGSGGVDAAYPASPGAFFLVRSDAASNDPVGLVSPPLTNGQTVDAVGSTEATGLRVVGASGSRVVLGNPAASTFAIVDGAGVAGASHASTPTTPTPALAGLTAPFGFAFGGDGTVLWSTRLSLSGVPTAALVWLVDGQSSFFQSTYALLGTYAGAAAGARLAGQSTLVTSASSGAGVAVATAAAPSDLAKTIVRLVTYDGQRTDVPASPSFTLPAPPSAVVLRTAGAYAVAASPSSVVGHVSLDVFDPGCP